jgi:hypothetical protein
LERSAIMLRLGQRTRPRAEHDRTDSLATVNRTTAIAR